jgi:hypothetical protein
LKLPAPDELASVPRSEIPALLCHLNSLAAALSARLLAEDNEPDELLDVAAAAQHLKVSESHIYHHAKHWPFTVRVGGKLLFSSRGIDRYLRSRQGAR